MKINQSTYNGNSGIYIAVEPTHESMKKIHDVLLTLNCPVPLDQFKDEAHMTVVYSRQQAIKDLTAVHKFASDNPTINALTTQLEFWEGHDKSGYLVLKMTSALSRMLNGIAINSGAKHSFDDYTPHMTILNGFNEDQQSKIQEWIKTANGILTSIPFLVEFDKIIIDDCKQK